MKQADMEEDNMVIMKWKGPSDVISGADVKVYFIKDGEEISVPEVQGVHYNGMDENNSYVDISYVVFNYDPIEPVKNSQFIRLKSCGQEGAISSCEFQLADQSWNRKSWGINIDDIITEGHIRLDARELKPWTKAEF